MHVSAGGDRNLTAAVVCEEKAREAKFLTRDSFGSGWHPTALDRAVSCALFHRRSWRFANSRSALEDQQDLFELDPKLVDNLLALLVIHSLLFAG
jgi:hypothetical protein